MGCGIKLVGCGTSLAIQWLSLHTSPAGSMGSLPGQGTKILPAMQHEKKKSELYQYLKKIKQSKWKLSKFIAKLFFPACFMVMLTGIATHYGQLGNKLSLLSRHRATQCHPSTLCVLRGAPDQAGVQGRRCRGRTIHRTSVSPTGGGGG